MMVTISNGDSFLQPLLSGSTANKLDNVKIYTTFVSKVQDGENAEHICEELQSQSAELTAKLCGDVESDNNELAMAALQALGLCLHSERVAKAFQEADFTLAIQCTCRVVQKTMDKATCTRALWCLASGAMPAKVLKDEVESIISAIECALCTKNFKSMTVEHEGLNAIIRLLEQIPEDMKPHIGRWAKLVYPLLLHGASKIRERAVVAMDLGMPIIKERPTDVAKSLMADLKSKDKTQSLLLEQLTRLMSVKQEIFALKVWEYYVTILGKLLHHGQLINQLLPFVEQGFKNSAPEVKCAAYSGWKTLIDNFALNPDIVADGKRVKLVMQVFKLSNAKVESVAVEKLSAWYFFLRKLGTRAASYFDTVAVPLLNYCVGGVTAKAPVPGSGARTPTASRLGIIGSPATPGSPMPQFRRLQQGGAQVLGRILGSPIDDPSAPMAKFTMDPLDEDLIAGPAFFVKHSTILITAVRECITNLQNGLEDGLLHHIWFCLVAHVKNVLEHTNKKDAAEVLSAFLTCLQHLVVTQALPPEKLLKLLQAVLVLPAKALASPSYAIGTSQTGMMQGTPVLFLLDLLFNHRLLETSSDQERFYTLLEKLIVCGMTNQSGALGFTKAVLQLIDQAAPKLDERESVWRMWSLAINPLLEHILKTNEVNAGDALEHDFSCMYAALQLPLLHLLSSDFSQQALKSMLRTWTETYTTFARLAALVTNADANVCCEELSSRIVAMIDNNRDKLKDMACVETLTTVCQVIIGQIDYSGVKGGNQFTSSGLLSPGKFMTKKKQHPLGNLHSFIKLIVLVTEGLHQAADGSLQDTKISGPSLQIAAISLIDVLSGLFTHVPTTTVIAVMLEKLAPSLAQVYVGSAQKPPNKMYSSQVLQKLEKLWLDTVTCMQARYQGLYDSDFLAHVSPLLEATFLHPRRPIKNQTNILWNATFSHASHLVYPAALKSVLAKVKEKTPISLPGWDATEIMLVEETPLSQMSQGAESQVPLPNIVGLSSPHKAVGSFMNKLASPDVKKSPLKRAKSPAVGGARKKLGLDDMNSQDFVVITPTTRRTRVLTEHQREVRHERRALPAMYNNLDASQDRSMMSQGGNSMDTSSADVSQIPFSFSVANKSNKTSTDKTPEEPKPEFKDPEPPAKEEPSKPEKKVMRRRSVTFAPSPIKTKRGSKDESDKESEPIDDEPTSPAKEQPTVLLGQPVTATKTQKTVKETEENTNNDTLDCIPETELTEMSPKPDIDPSPGNVLQSDSEASEAPKDSQDSETLLKAKPKAPRGRKPKSVSAGDESQGSDSESSGQEGKGAAASRRSPRKQSPRKQPSGKKVKAEGMKKLENWFNPSPKKSITPAVLVEESQQFSPSKMNPLETGLSPVASPEVIVEETPAKDGKAEDSTEKEDLAKATKSLFGRKVLVPDSEVVESETQVGQKETQLVIPDSEIAEDRKYPVVQLARLTESDLKRLSPKKESSTESSVVTTIGSSVENSSDDTVRKVTEPTPTAVVKKLRRRSSIKYSKASQENASPVSPINMDDIIPSSQDCFGLDNQKSNSNSITKITKSSSICQGEEHPDSVIVVSQTERETGVEQMEVDLDETVDPRVEQKPESDTAPVIIDMKKDSMDSSGGNAIENPDIVPADLSSKDCSQDSQATIVPARKRGRPKKMKVTDEPDSADSSLLSVSTLDSSFESSQEASKVKGRPNRRRSMPSKFRDTETVLTPEKGKKEKELKLRPADTMADCPHDDSMDIASSQESIASSQESQGSEKVVKKRGRKKTVDKKAESEEKASLKDAVENLGDVEKKAKKLKKTSEDKIAKEEDIVSSQESVSETPVSEKKGKKRGRKSLKGDKVEAEDIVSSQESVSDLQESEKKVKKKIQKPCKETKADQQTNEPEVIVLSQQSDADSELKGKKVKKSVKEKKPIKDVEDPTEESQSQQKGKKKKKQTDDSPKANETEKKVKVRRKSMTKKEKADETKSEKALEKVVSKDCNLDVASDSDDDVPIVLSKPQKKKVEEKDKEIVVTDVTSGETDDDVPLTMYKQNSKESASLPQTGVKDSEIAHSDKLLAEQDDDIVSVEDIFDDSARTSTPTKPAIKGKAKKSSGILSNLAINMKTTSPVNKRLRSKGSLKLNRSMNSLQKRKRSPVNPFSQKPRSKSVSPTKRLKRLKKEPTVVVIEDSQDKEIELMKGTELSSSEGSEPAAEAGPSQADTKPAAEEDGESESTEPVLALDPTLKDIKGTPRRSPRKLLKEESPQKSSLSPTRRPVTQSIEMPETPTSATKHQSRASLILERSKLFSAPRTSSMYDKKKFTTLKPAAADTVIEDLISPGKSILKPTAAKAEEASGSGGIGTDVRASPPPPTKPTGAESSPSFRPVQIPRIYSPSASPSAGILKKRKLNSEVPTDSPSPPNKMRRVSFNEAVDVCQLAGKESSRPVNRCLDMPAKALRTTSPLVASSSKVTANQSKFVTSQNTEASETEKGACFAMPHPVNKKKDVEPSPNSIKSTAESQLNCQDPIFPELQSCTDPIDQILAQLTSSTWIRGLGQLIRSKNIRTIGDLCALTEYEVNNLPIRTPKVATVRQVLEAYSTQLEQRKPKPTPSPAEEEQEQEEQEKLEEEKTETEIEVLMEDQESKIEETPKTLDSPSKEPLPSVEEALAMSPIREADTSIESMSEMQLDLKSDEPLSATDTKSADPTRTDDDAGTADEAKPTEHEYHFRDPLSSQRSADSLTPSVEPEKPSQRSADSLTPSVEPEKPTQLSSSVTLGQGQSKTPTAPTTTSTERKSPRSLLKEMEGMAQRLTPDVLTELPANYLVAVHMHLNTMMTNVILAQSNQCPLTLTSSQDSETQPE